MDKKTVYPLLASRCIIFPAVFVSGAAIVGKKTGDIVSRWTTVASAVNALTILMLIFIAKKHKLTYRELINYRKGHSGARKIILTALATLLIGMGGMYLSGLIFYGSVMPAVSLRIIAPVPKAAAIINLIVLPVTTALAEDGLYLGAGVGQLPNSRAGIAVPAFFYALQHCFIPTIFDIKYMIYRFLMFLPLIVLFCINYRKNRDPLPIMAGHALLDLATAVSVLATSVIPDVYDKMSEMIK